MKKLLLVLTLVTVFSCSNNQDDPCNPNPELVTLSPSNIGENSATINGEIDPPECDSNFINQGFVYSINVQPTLNSGTQINVNGNVVSTQLNNLVANTTYYYRTFFQDNQGVFYGNEISFKTNVGQTLIETLPVIDITQSSSKFRANITSDGNSEITERGFVYDIDSSPTIEDTKLLSGSGTGLFSVTVNQLNANQTYFVRSYSINESGITYGNEVEFTTECNIATGSLNFNIDRQGGQISAIFNYDISIPTVNFNLTSILLTFNDENNNNFEETISSSQATGTITINNLIPKTVYNNVRITINSSDCGTFIIEPSNTSFTTPARYDVGDSAEGGIIIYMYDNGINGIAASTTDAGEGNWACDTTNNPVWGGYTGTNTSDINSWDGSIGDGESYSQAIIDFLVNGTGNSSNGYFANFCDCLSNDKAVELADNFNHNGYSDWYLPHIKTLDLIYDLYSQGILSDFIDMQSPCGTGTEPIYVSSSGDGANAGWINFNLTGNYAGYVGKGSFGAKFRVRPVRKF